MTREPAVTALHMRAIEPLLGMAAGYVLDFTNEEFAGFFADFKVNIDSPTYAVHGTSKAKRLRQFLRVASPELCSKVLVELMRHRLAMPGPPVTDDEVHAYMEVVVELDGGNADIVQALANRRSAAASSDGAIDLPHPEFTASLLDELAAPPEVPTMVTALITEALVCERAGAFLAATILLGSALEAMCIGYGEQHRSAVLKAASVASGKAATSFDRWMLNDWIATLSSLGALSPNVVKYAHGLREFRNYIHPARARAEAFTPNARTVDIGYRVVMAAVEDLSRAAKVA